MTRVQLQYVRESTDGPVAFANCKARVTTREIIVESGKLLCSIGGPLELHFPYRFDRRTGRGAIPYGWQLTPPSLNKINDD